MYLFYLVSFFSFAACSVLFSVSRLWCQTRQEHFPSGFHSLSPQPSSSYISCVYIYKASERRIQRRRLECCQQLPSAVSFYARSSSSTFSLNKEKSLKATKLKSIRVICGLYGLARTSASSFSRPSLFGKERERGSSSAFATVGTLPFLLLDSIYSTLALYCYVS